MSRATTRNAKLGLAVSLTLLAGCHSEKPVPLPPVAAAARPDGTDFLNGPMRTTMVPGTAVPPAVPRTGEKPIKPGDISLNFPNADVRVVAQAVLGDMLRLQYSVDPAVNGTVSVVTAAPVARESVLEIFERALRASNFALVAQGRGFQITTVAAAGGQVAANATGYGSEVITLKFVGATTIKRLLDGLLPNVVSAIDESNNSLMISGTTGQRAAVRDILGQFDVNWLRNMSFALFVPQRTDARLITPELEKLINDNNAPTKGLVRLIAMEKLNGILAISAQTQYLNDVQRWVDILDREGQNNERKLFVYQVQNGRARDLARTLNTAFGLGTPSTAGSDQGNGGNSTAPGPQPAAPTPPAATPVNATAVAGSEPASRVTISADETNNAIVVFGTPRDYAVVEEALRKLDVLPFQVLIEAAITEVGLTDNLRYGVQWNFTSGENNFALGEGETPAPIRNLPGFSYFYSNNSDISATLNALEKRTNVKVISAPKLLVLNNQTAALQVGDQVPITTQSATNVVTANSAIVNSVEYKDTGVILRVTPRVNASGIVLLDIAQEVSDVQPNQTSKIDSPTISTRKISTSIAAQDGQVIALGGMFRNSQSYGKNGLPLLSRIPILGGLLFGNNNNQTTRTELLVILKAHVLRTMDDGRAITEELRSKLRTLEPFKTSGTVP